MKKTSKLVLVLAALALLAAACGSDDASSIEGQTISVGVENAYPPYNFIDDATGEGAGFDYDIWREICSRLSCTAEFVEAGWPAVIEETGQGVYDTAADGISITDERKEVVDFSDPYMTITQRFMVRLDETRFSTADEFIAGDYRLGTQVGTTNYELGVELVGDPRIDAFDQFGVAVQALIAGDVDAVIIDDTAGQGYVGVNADQTKLLPDELQSDPLGFIYPQGSELVGPVNDVLKEMEDDGTLEALIVEWFIDYDAG
ncbi:MAG: transporter substrate-binding domain-containing protein [Acidimicrobiia bacterium]|nr:transporter substrate-binding domain-containing protein [Acidimicrobiia bacterium]